METKSLYIHIPFCQNICSYCDFCKVYYQEELVEKYLLALKKEIESFKIINPLRTIYIGGGTPSSLSYSQLEFLMGVINPYIDQDTIEVSMEVNPESMDTKKLAILKNGLVNRLSIGVQTFNENILKSLQRKHTNEQVFRLIKEAKILGFDNLSIDLMYGLPNQTVEDVQTDISIIATLDIQHISYYALILEEHTKLRNQKYSGIDEDTEVVMDERIATLLPAMGFHQYEVSNYAKDTFTSKHNLVYWHYENYYGAGIGASGKIDDYFIEHNRNIYSYVNGENTTTKVLLQKEESIFNNIMMSLRLREGLDIKKINSRYQIEFEVQYRKVIKKYMDIGWLHMTNGRLYCDEQSFRYLNTILVDFLD